MRSSSSRAWQPQVLQRHRDVALHRRPAARWERVYSWKTRAISRGGPSISSPSIVAEPGGDRLKPGEALQEGGLADAGRSDDAGRRYSPAHLEGEIGDDLHRPGLRRVGLREAVSPERRTGALLAGARDGCVDHDSFPICCEAMYQRTTCLRNSAKRADDAYPMIPRRRMPAHISAMAKDCCARGCGSPGPSMNRASRSRS